MKHILTVDGDWLQDAIAKKLKIRNQQIVSVYVKSIIGKNQTIIEYYTQTEVKK